MSKRLDRARPFGQVYGSATAAYEQDGILFEHDEWEVGTPLDERNNDPKPQADTGKAKDRPAPGPISVAAIRKQLRAAKNVEN